MEKDAFKSLVALALTGSVFLTPLVATSTTAYAKEKDENTATVFSGYNVEINNFGWYELEKDSIQPFSMHGIHYVSAWVKIYGASSNPLGGLFGKTRNFEGNSNIIIKFEENGSYHGEILHCDQKRITSLKNDSVQITLDWEKRLAKKYSSQNDQTRTIGATDMDIFNPKEWHDTSYAYVENGLEDAWKKAVNNTAKYIKNNYPDVVLENIALNKRDEANALAQHKAELETKKELSLKNRATIADKNQALLLKGYNENVPQDTVSGLGSYTWDMFLQDDAPRPNMDVNKLIQHTWRVDYIGAIFDGCRADGLRSTKSLEFHEVVRFQPVFFVDSATSEIKWDNSLLEVDTLYHVNDKYGEPHKPKGESFIMELTRTNGLKFDANPSIEEATSKTKGEKKIYVSHDPSEGDFKTTSATPYYYTWQSGEGNDFYLVEYYYRNGTPEPTYWKYHFTMIE